FLAPVRYGRITELIDAQPPTDRICKNSSAHGFSQVRSTAMGNGESHSPNLCALSDFELWTLSSRFSGNRSQPVPVRNQKGNRAADGAGEGSSWGSGCGPAAVHDFACPRSVPGRVPMLFAGLFTRS